MQNCRTRVCNAFVDAFEKIIALLFSPFKLDKLFGIAGIGLITSPSLFDWEGSVVSKSKYLEFIIKFSNEISVISYILGSLLCLAAIYLFHKREFKVDDLNKYKELHEANMNSESGALLQFIFSSIFKFSPTIKTIKYLLNTDDPIGNITDFKNARFLVSFDKKFTLKNAETNLKKMKNKADLIYFVFSFLIILSYVAFNTQWNNGSTGWSILWLVLSIIFIPIAFIGFSNNRAASSANRLLNLPADKA